MSGRAQAVVALLVFLIILLAPSSAAAESVSVQATILHTNDIHGHLVADENGRGGVAYLADRVSDFRAGAGAENVLLLDAGDEFFAAPDISQKLLGESTIDVFNLIGYDLATIGNHEFDSGQHVLRDRIEQAQYPWLGANIVLEGTEWDLPPWALPYHILTVGTGEDQATIGVIGLGSEESPILGANGRTEGLIFKDLTETILHYYDEVRAQSDAVIVVAHMGPDDSSRGPYDGLKTVAQKLIDAGKPVDIMISGHKHLRLNSPIWIGETAIVATGEYGKYLGQIDVSIDKSSRRLSVDYYKLHPIAATVTIESLAASVAGFYATGELTDTVVRDSLLGKLAEIDEALGADNAQLAAELLAEFSAEISALDALQITPVAANTLLADVAWFLENCNLEVAARIAYWAGRIDLVYATILHTNDFHGQLMPDAGQGGAAYLADKVTDLRAASGGEDVLLLDAGDQFFNEPDSSQALLGESTVDIFNLMSYDLAAIGNHEFDLGQQVLRDRIAQSQYTWLGANIVLEGTDWDHPTWVLPYHILTFGTEEDQARLGVIGLSYPSTPPQGGDGLAFKDITETILHYYDEVLAQSDAVIVVAHMGIPGVDNLQAVARELDDAGKPVGLMIGGHTHVKVSTPVRVETAALVIAGEKGKYLGQISVSIEKNSKRLFVDKYKLHPIAADVTIESLANSIAEFDDAGAFTDDTLRDGLLEKLTEINAALAADNAQLAGDLLAALITELSALNEQQITPDAANALLTDVAWFLENCNLEVAARVAYWAGRIVPPAVSGVSASDGTYFDKVEVTWNQTFGTHTYKVYRADSIDGARTTFVPTEEGIYNDRSAKIEATYYYWVRACNEAGCSKWGSVDTGYVPTPTSVAVNGLHVKRATDSSPAALLLGAIGLFIATRLLMRYWP